MLQNNECVMITVFINHWNVSGMVMPYSLIFHYVFINAKEIQKHFHVSQNLLRMKSPSLSIYSSLKLLINTGYLAFLSHHVTVFMNLLKEGTGSKEQSYIKACCIKRLKVEKDKRFEEK